MTDNIYNSRNLNDNEKKLIQIIRDHKHPEQALITAIETTLYFLKQHQSSEVPLVADFQESS